jgi:hypothetical protein
MPPAEMFSVGPIDLIVILVVMRGAVRNSVLSI